MKSKEEIKTTTDFWNDLMKEMWENESGYSFEHFNRVMQEYATQQTSAIQAERDEYRKALEGLAYGCSWVNLAGVRQYDYRGRQINKVLNKYPQH